MVPTLVDHVECPFASYTGISFDLKTGDDSLIADADTVPIPILSGSTGGSGGDVITGGAGNDTIDCGPNVATGDDDFCDGDAGNDTVLGDIGDDGLVGGPGQRHARWRSRRGLARRRLRSRHAGVRIARSTRSATSTAPRA